ncbi:NAD(P)/FAD-dependent oxidoreductase [Rhodococcus opacus]|uniref:NAD(P)/FAD-dependent oxidoreductase n=1 Tax=Rhodococcus opacus TaxID=37919 RepID=UPI00155A424E|nr:FAD-dependent oxidoreductase [Rhodococcus opacus]
MSVVAEDPFVVVGASLAGLRAVEEARASGYSGRIVLIGAEAHIPYDRPPLSKQFLVPEAIPDYLTLEEDLREALDVELRLSSTAVSLDPAQRRIHLQSGESVSYAKLLITTGANARIIPSLSGKDGVLTLRSLDDAQELRRRLTPGANVVIIGAGFIGSETASSAQKRGANVVIVESASIPLVRAVGPIVGHAVSSLHARNQVRLLTDTQVIEVLGEDAVHGVRLATGEVLPADVVVVGIGAEPATSWLHGSGIELDARDGGIKCDAMLRTSLPDVFAAGDVVHWPNEVLDSTVMRLENWTNAAEQGRRAANNALWPAGASAYSAVPYFWSDWYDQRIQFVGSATADEVRFVSGDPATDKWVALYRSHDRLIGAATLNEPRKIMKYRRMIDQKMSWTDAVNALKAAPVSV